MTRRFTRHVAAAFVLLGGAALLGGCVVGPAPAPYPGYAYGYPGYGYPAYGYGGAAVVVGGGGWHGGDGGHWGGDRH
jgi:hypothetical protein